MCLFFFFVCVWGGVCIRGVGCGAECIGSYFYINLLKTYWFVCPRSLVCLYESVPGSGGMLHTCVG